MRRLVLMTLCFAFGSPAAGAAQEIVAEVQVHGNTLTPDADVIRLSGLSIGMALDEETVAIVSERLRATKRFEGVDVLKRFASIADPNRVAIVILLDEGPVRIEWNGDKDVAPRVRKAGAVRPMFLPLVDAEDGYGLTYGIRVAVPNVAGTRSRLSFPFTWGGEKRAALEFDKELSSGPVSRIEAGGAIARRTNPSYDENDDRDRLWARAELELARAVRLGATGSWERVSFLGAHDRFGRHARRPDAAAERCICQGSLRSPAFSRRPHDQSKGSRGSRVPRPAGADCARCSNPS
jgi:hypothetical protein